MTAAKRPAPPKHLRAAGKRTWRALLADLPPNFELTNRETELLRAAAGQADLVADLEAALKSEGLSMVGAAGQRRLNGAATELRQSRLALARLLGEIVIPDLDGAAMPTPASSRAQKAADTRWRKDRQAKERAKANA